MTFIMTFIGGPHDGAECRQSRPWRSRWLPGDHVYAADDRDGSADEWAGDGVRRIVLRYIGKMAKVENEGECNGR